MDSKKSMEYSHRLKPRFTQFAFLNANRVSEFLKLTEINSLSICLICEKRIRQGTLLFNK